MKRILLSLLFFTVVFAPVYGTDSVLVLGFQNLGDASDDDINPMIAKAIISQMMKVEDVKIVSYDDSVVAAEGIGFYEMEEINSDKVEEAGIKVSVKKVVYGTFFVNDEEETLTINYYVYNVQTGEVMLTRELSGPSGFEIFDSIDSMVEKVTTAVLGFSADFDTFDEAIALNRHKNLTRLIIPGGVALTAGVGALMNVFASNTLEDYNRAYLFYMEADDNFDFYWAEVEQSYKSLKNYQVMQTIFYSTAGALALFDAYLLIAKPGLSDSRLNFYSDGMHFGFSYEF